MAKFQVRDLMTEDVFSVRADDMLEAAFNIMEERHVRHVPVVDGDGNIEGLVSHRDLMGVVFVTSSESQTMDLEALETMEVQEIMVGEVETVEPDEDVREAGKIMLENKLGCMPVVEGTRLVGILTEADFVKHLVRN